MKMRVLRHQQGICIRAWDGTARRVAHAIVYHPEYLRHADCRRVVRDKLRADLAHYHHH